MARLLVVGFAVAAIVLASLPAQAGPAAPTAGPPPASAAPTAATVTVQYLTSGDCLTWPTGSQVAMQYAADAWGAKLASAVPIIVNACWKADLGGNVLGTGMPSGATWTTNFAEAVYRDTFYPGALTNAVRGADGYGGIATVTLHFDGDSNWHFGTGMPAGGQVDFITVAMHELAHGLGFIGNVGYSSGAGVCSAYGPPYTSRFPCPTPYDRLATTSDGAALLSYPMLPFPTGDPFMSGTLLTTGNNVWFSGANAMSRNGGSRVQLYTPPSWNEGSSYTHLGDSFAAGSDSLMSAQYGLVTREPSPLTVAIMRDMGWPLASSVPQVKISGFLTRTVGQDATYVADFLPASTPGYIRYEWTFEGLSPQDHPGQPLSDTAYVASWPTAGRKLVTLKASPSTGTPVHAVFAVEVTSPSTVTPSPTVSSSPTASPTRTASPSPTATPAARSLLPYVTRP